MNEIDSNGLVEGIYLLRITDMDGKSHGAQVAVKEIPYLPFLKKDNFDGI